MTVCVSCSRKAMYDQVYITDRGRATVDLLGASSAIHCSLTCPAHTPADENGNSTTAYLKDAVAPVVKSRIPGAARREVAERWDKAESSGSLAPLKLEAEGRRQVLGINLAPSTGRMQFLRVY
jgi:hypothetical protein